MGSLVDYLDTICSNREMGCDMSAPRKGRAVFVGQLNALLNSPYVCQSEVRYCVPAQRTHTRMCAMLLRRDDSHHRAAFCYRVDRRQRGETRKQPPSMQPYSSPSHRLSSSSSSSSSSSNNNNNNNNYSNKFNIMTMCLSINSYICNGCGDKTPRNLILFLDDMCR
jgi:hypothetical protein